MAGMSSNTHPMELLQVDQVQTHFAVPVDADLTLPNDANDLRTAQTALTGATLNLASQQQRAQEDGLFGVTVEAQQSAIRVDPNDSANEISNVLDELSSLEFQAA